MTLSAIAIDWAIGDPRWPTHPVIWIGRLIGRLEVWLLRSERADAPVSGTKIAAEAGAGGKPAASGTSPENVAIRGGAADSASNGPDAAENVAGGAEAAAARSAAVAGGLYPFVRPPAHRCERRRPSPGALRLKGAVLACVTVGASFAAMWALWAAADRLHPWLGYAVNVWFISTTIAVKGLKDAAMSVYGRLRGGDLEGARRCVGQIVGRDSDRLDEPEVVRAAVETVAENTGDAVVAPLFYALLGGAPLAMLYRAANTLDSMVGYKNAKYVHFGWASARLDDALNFVPARLAGLLIIVWCAFIPGLSARRSYRAVRVFARLHPSPNSGVPEAAVAGAIGVRLGGENRYGGVVSRRAYLGWPLTPLNREHIALAVRILYGVSYLIAGGLFGLWIAFRLTAHD
jgi:adenosylcobinamide-phosphate synthase